MMDVLLKSGYNESRQRLSWPDTTPGATNVNSTPFMQTNISKRNITTIKWGFNDIGEIVIASNIRVWTNMSGTRTDSYTVDAGGETTTIDISTIMAGGGEWEPGNRIWWKFEIIALGSISEDLHSNIQGNYYRVGFT